ncbi:MAG: B12-binding domain-containing radical SAM protein [Thermodesulfobacteriota bacterium]
MTDKQLNILVVAPRYVSTKGRYYEFPLGLAYISAALKHAGFKVSCLNLNHSDRPESDQIRQAIEQHNISVFCVGGLSPHFARIRSIIEAARAVRDDITVILGGGIISSAPELIMEALCPDFGVIGEGEETIVELMRIIQDDGDVASVNGLAFRDARGTTVLTQPRRLIDNIDSIPWPDYEGFGLDEYLAMQLPADEYHLYLFDNPRVMPMIASRSCPYRCTFCFHPLGNKYRQRSLDGFFAEFDYLVERYRVNIVSISDELFSQDIERTREFCDRVKPYGVKFLVQMRVDSVDAETLARLRESGCIAISYGLESASNTVLKSMKKQTTIDRIEKALDLTYRAGIGIQGNFIFGDKAETLETARETLGWWARHRKYQINLTPLFCYPGTGAYRHALETGVIRDQVRFLENGCLPLNITTLADEEYNRLIAEIYETRLKNPIPAEVLSCKVEGRHASKGDLYGIEILCPHCRQAVSYRNMHQDGNMMFWLGSRLHCRNCHQRFDILPYRFYEIIQTPGFSPGKVESLAGIRDVAIFGASIAGNSVYEFCASHGKRVLYFVDDFKKGAWGGLEIITPDEVAARPRPEVTIFACGSPEQLPLFREKAKAWPYSRAYLFARNLFPQNPGHGADNFMFQYYFHYYKEIWLPLLGMDISTDGRTG